MDLGSKAQVKIDDVGKAYEVINLKGHKMENCLKIFVPFTF